MFLIVGNYGVNHYKSRGGTVNIVESACQTVAIQISWELEPRTTADHLLGY